MGGSAGLNLHAAVEISKNAEPGSVIVAILADNGVKYLTKIYNNDWIKAKVWPCLLLLHWLNIGMLQQGMYGCSYCVGFATSMVQ